MSMRRSKPPVTYHEIVKILKDKYDLDVTHNAIWSYVKRRSTAHVVMRRYYSQDDPPPSKLKDIKAKLSKSEPAPIPKKWNIPEL